MILLLNREFKAPTDGWFQIVPLGEFAHPSGVSQVIDIESITAMLNRFAADSKAPGFGGILVDYDHFSLDTDKSSEAAGWIVNMQNRSDGLYAQIRWAGDGEAKVLSGAFRYVSPVWNRNECQDLGNNRVRPLRLQNVALTNDPNIKGIRPLTNRAGADTGKTQAGTPSGKESTMDYKAELLAMLGLPAEATDEQIAAAKAARQSEIENACKASDTMKNRAEAAEAKVKDFEQKALETQVEKDLDTHAPVIGNRADVKAQLLANREGTLKVLTAIKPAPAAEAPAALKNRGTPPVPSKERGAMDAQKAFVEEVRIKNRCTYSQAFDLARQQKPDLFEQKPQ